MFCIAEIVSRFDVMHIGQVGENLSSLDVLHKLLGENWDYLTTDLSRTAGGSYSRRAFLYDSKRVNLSGLVGELVVPPNFIEQVKIHPTALDRQFTNTPYAFSFRISKSTFTALILHAQYGSGPSEKVREMKAIAKWLAYWAKSSNKQGHNLIFLGDFNVDRTGDMSYDALVSSGLKAPSELNLVPRTIFNKKNSGSRPFYDQIGWITFDDFKPALSVNYSRAGSFDFTKVVLKTRELSKKQLSWHISNHYPLWVEFSLDDN